jgi:hypothetical protein
MEAADFVEVTIPTEADVAAELAAEGAIAGDTLRQEANSHEARLATAERYGSSIPGPVSSPQAAQLLQELTAAETQLADAAGFALPSDTPSHKDYLTAQPERPGNAEDRRRTRLRIEALNAPRELNGLAPYATADAAPPGAEIGGSLGVEFSDAELDAYAEEGRDPVAEAAEQIIEREQRSAVQAISVARREQAIQAEVAQHRAAQQEAYDRQARNAIEAARARGADESWIQFALSMGQLPGHPDTR